MDLKETYNNITIKELEEFVAKKRQEDLYLEFKQSNHPVEDEYDRKNFSKCLSGFANSSGGLIVWGIEASKDKKGVDAAKKLKPIKELDKFRNKLLRWEGQAITPETEGVDHRKLNNPENKDEGYMLTYIPKSDNAPHMANYCEKHYYKRSGDSFYICEHYDIIDMINRKVSPKLKLHIDSFEFGRDESGKNKVDIIVSIENYGKVIAKYPYLSLSIGNQYKFYEFGIDGNYNRGLTIIPTAVAIGKRQYGGGSEMVIYPETIHQVDIIRYSGFGLEASLPDLTLNYTLVAESMEKIEDILEVKGTDITNKFRRETGTL